MSKCPACGAFSFIDLEGIAVISETEPSEEIVEAFPERSSPRIEIDPEFVAEPSDEFASFGEFAEMPPIETPPSADANLAAEIASAEFESFEISESADVVATPVRPTSTKDESAFGPADDPLMINEFANSEASSAKDGPWLFRVFISGIDTKEIRESIREVLEDSRFAWDSNEIFSQISKGHLAVDALSPVKASILITRIKYLPISIRWEQYAITQGPRS